MIEECKICDNRKKLRKQLERIKEKGVLMEYENRRVEAIETLNECPICAKEKTIKKLNKKEEIVIEKKVKHNIVASKCTTYGFTKHIHICSICKTRFPKRGDYAGDFEDDALEIIIPIRPREIPQKVYQEEEEELWSS